MAKRFPHFQLLPAELRQIVYSKMELAESAPLAGISEDAFLYFMRHPKSVGTVYVAVSVDDGIASVKVDFDRRYIEKHIIPDSMREQLWAEIYYNSVCECEWCKNGYPQSVYPNHLLHFADPPLSTVHHYEWQSIDNVFFTLQMVDAQHVAIKTARYAGLVERAGCLGRQHHSVPSPPIRRNRKVSLHFHDHPMSIRNILDVQKWNSWLEFFGGTSIQLECRGIAEQIDCELFDCNAVRNARTLHCRGPTAVNLDQVLQLKAEHLTIFPNQLQKAEYIEIYRRTLWRWLENNRLRYDIEILGTTERFQGYLHGLVEVFHEILQNDIDLGSHYQTRRYWDYQMQKESVVVMCMETVATFHVFPNSIHTLNGDDNRLIVSFKQRL